MNKKQSQSGFAHLIIIVVLSLALFGALGFVFYQNFIQKKDSISKTDTEKTADESSEETDKVTTPSVAPATVVNDFLTSFLSYMAMPTTDSHNETSFAAQSSALTDDFRSSITKPNQGLMRSPIILTQALPTSFVIGSTSEASGVQSVFVTLKFGENPTTIIYNLILVNNEWKINGVYKA